MIKVAIGNDSDVSIDLAATLAFILCNGKNAYGGRGEIIYVVEKKKEKKKKGSMLIERARGGNSEREGGNEGERET